MGIELSPEFLRALTDLGTNERSREEASRVVWKLLRIEVDPKVIERCTRRIGEERQAERTPHQADAATAGA